MKTTKVLIAKDMSCGHCKAAIEGAVRDLPGVSDVIADPATKRVTLTFDHTTIGIDDLRKIIEEAGYATESAD
jgi:copper chaperone